MKKFVLLVFLGLLFAPITRAATTDVPSNVYFFGDGKGYNENGDQKYFCFTDGSCYSVEGVFAFVRQVQGIVANLQTRVTNLENPAQKVAGISSEQNSKAQGIKGEITAYITKLNGQINDINNSVVPEVGIAYPPVSYRFEMGSDGVNRTIVTESNLPPTIQKLSPDTAILYFKDVSKFEFPKGFTNNAQDFVTNSKNKLRGINETISQLNIITFDINDYLSTGVIISSYDRAYLQSLGINW